MPAIPAIDDFRDIGAPAPIDRTLGGYIVPGVVPTSSDAASTAANYTALQAALTAGFASLLPGLYYLSKTLLQPGDCILNAPYGGVTIKLADNSNCNILRNKNAGVNIAASQFVRASNVVTVSEPGHPRNVGDVVYVAGLLTDTSFNSNSATITTVTSGSWSYASTGSNGSPTGFGIVFPVNNTIAGANFVRASNLVTVTEANHTKKAGDPVWIGALTGDTSFNGPYEIISAPPGSWTYASTGSNGSPTGTAVVSTDSEMFISNIKFDGNTANQISANSYDNTTATFGAIFNNCKFQLYNCRGLNQRKYCFWAANTSANVDTVDFQTISDGMHFEAPLYKAYIRKLAGFSNDDLLAFTNVKTGVGGSYEGYASPSGVGNFGVVFTDGVYPIGGTAPSIVKLTGYQCSFDFLYLKNIVGRGQTAVNRGLVITDDTASLTQMNGNTLIVDNLRLIKPTGDGSTVFEFSTTGTWKSMQFINCYVDSGDNWTYWMRSVTTGGTIKKLAFNNCRVDSTPTLASNGIISITCNVDRINFENCEANIAAGAYDFFRVTTPGAVKDVCFTDFRAVGGSTVSRLVQLFSGTVDRVFYNNVTVDTMQGVFYQNGIATGTDVYADNCALVGCNEGFNATAAGCNFYVNNVRAATIANNLFQLGGTAITHRIVGKNIDVPSGKFALLTFQTPNISISCREAFIDMGANAGAPPARLVPLAGDEVWNTNATGTGLYGRTAAGAWTKVF